MAHKTAVVVGDGRIGMSVQKHLSGLGYFVVSASHQCLELADLRSVSIFFSHLKTIDVLVNAAGSYGAVGCIRDVAPEEWRKALDINLLGVYACCHHAIPKMPIGGHIITLAGGGKGPLNMRSGLAASKTALVRLNETLAAEEPKLYVNAIAPGPAYSRMQDAIIGLPTQWAEEFRKMRDSGVGEVPDENTLRVIDHILQDRPTGQLFFAREFKKETDERRLSIASA